MPSRPKQQVISALLISMCLALLCQLPGRADLNSDLADQYLEREFSWAMFIDVHDMKQYLKYPGSRLNPLTQLRVYYRAFPPDKSTMIPAAIYHEYWYHQEVPIGLRQYSPLKIEPNKFGVIIVGAVEDNSVGSVTNVLVRLLVDLSVKKMVTSVVLVPREKYYQIAEGLARYYFFPNIDVAQGQQVSIHLRAYPSGKDEYLFHHGHVGGQ